MWTHARRIRSASLSVLLALCIVLGGVGQGQAKEFEIDGTADCGRANEERCAIGSVLALWTDDIDGTRHRVEIDVSWIKDALEKDKIDQDDHVCLIVEDLRAKRLKAVGMSDSCRFGGTINPGLSTGSKEVSEQPDHNQDDDENEKQDSSTIIGPPGTVTGIVTNALTGQPLPGAVVQVESFGISATAGSNGRFTLADVPSGTRTLRTSASGFVTETRSVAVVAGSTVEQAIALTPGRPGGEITIVLTWAGQPRDLDAHLSGPTRSGGRFHIYYANPAGPSPDPYARLDVDDVASFGPETVTIARDSTTGSFVAGEYRYWVHNFSTSPEFDVSNGRVTVNSGGAQLESYTVPGGAVSLDIWRVVNLTIDASGNVTLNPIQSYAAGYDFTPFGVPSGSPPAPTVK